MEVLQKVYDVFRNGARITTDSREIGPGDIFIALKGAQHNGNEYAATALNAGAGYAVIDEVSYATGNQSLLVPDTLLFLQQLAAFHRQQLGIPILAITGTNGKTTTKELCHAVLSKKFRTVATRGNLNNHIGVPLTLLSMDASTEFGIIEMGANHPGEIKTLCEIAAPDYGLITNIGQAHLEGFGSFENILHTKGELYDYLKAKKATLFINGDNELLKRLAGNYPSITYGNSGNFTNGELLQADPFMVFDLKTPKGHLYIRTKLIGGYNLDNALAAVATGIYFGIDPIQVKEAIEAYTPSNLRSQLVKTERNTIILDAYNANPSSMHVAIKNFSGMKGDNKLLIIGEMLELGESSVQAHAELLEEIAAFNPSSLFLVGQSFESLRNKYTFVSYFNNTEMLIEYLKSHEIHSSMVLIKGSRGNRLERIVEYL